MHPALCSAFLPLQRNHCHSTVDNVVVHLDNSKTSTYCNQDKRFGLAEIVNVTLSEGVAKSDKFIDPSVTR